MVSTNKYKRASRNISYTSLHAPFVHSKPAITFLIISPAYFYSQTRQTLYVLSNSTYFAFQIRPRFDLEPSLCTLPLAIAFHQAVHTYSYGYE